MCAVGHVDRVPYVSGACHGATMTLDDRGIGPRRGVVNRDQKLVFLSFFRYLSTRVRYSTYSVTRGRIINDAIYEPPSPSAGLRTNAASWSRGFPGTVCQGCEE